MMTKTAYPAEKAESKTCKRKGRKKTLKVIASMRIGKACWMKGIQTEK